MGCSPSRISEIPDANINKTLPALYAAIKKNDEFYFMKVLGDKKLSDTYGLNRNTKTVLHYAAECNSFKILPILLNNIKKFYKSKSDFEFLTNIRDDKKRTPAMVAVMHDHLDCFKILLRNFACNFEISDSEEKKLEDHIDESKLCKEFFKKKGRPKKNEANEEKPPSATFGELLFPYSLEIHEKLQKVKESKKNFIDPDFPHTIDSIILRDSNGQVKEEDSEYLKAVWKRPHEFLGVDYSKIKVFDTVEPDDVLQGGLGVCYFLSALACLAEYPTRLMKIFQNPETNEEGIYSLGFFRSGVPEEVIIDDYFPCYDNSPIFSKARGKEIWVMILEKAWAKFYKNYMITKAGNAAWAFQSLTPAPAVVFNTIDYTEDELFNLIEDANKRRWMIVCGCYPPTDNSQETLGLVHRHAYSLLATYRFGDVKLVKVRNPWGDTEFKGDYSDTDEKWSDEMKKEVDLKVENDGVFHMTIKDFKKNFTILNICKYEDDWYYQYKLMVQRLKQKRDYVEFDITETTFAYFRMHQLDARTKGVSPKDYKPTAGDLIVCRVDGKEFQEVVEDITERSGNEFDINGTLSLRADGKYVELLPGSYFIRTSFYVDPELWKQNIQTPYAFSIYSNNKIVLKPSLKIKYSEFSRKRYTDRAKANLKKIVLREGIYYVKDWGDFDLYYVYFSNESDRAIEVTGSFVMTNFEFDEIPDLTTSDGFVKKIEAKSEFLFQVRLKDPTSEDRKILFKEPKWKEL